MVKNGWAEKIACSGCCTVQSAVTYQLCLLLNSGFDISDCALLIRLADDRAEEHPLVLAVADLQAACCLIQPAHQLIRYRLMHNNH
ncbi:hypothetical protein D3C86_1715750 [compost metagenome]